MQHPFSPEGCKCGTAGFQIILKYCAFLCERVYGFAHGTGTGMGTCPFVCMFPSLSLYLSYLSFQSMDIYLLIIFLK